MTPRNKALGLLAAAVVTAIAAAAIVLSYREQASRLTNALIHESTALGRIGELRTHLPEGTTTPATIESIRAELLDSEQNEQLNRIEAAVREWQASQDPAALATLQRQLEAFEKTQREIVIATATSAAAS